MRLSGKRALVTGAGSNGIGRAIVAAFCQEGALVAAHYFREPIPAADVQKIEATGPHRLVQLPGDIGDPAAARSLVQAANDALGGLDIFVACAAYTERVPLLSVTDEAFRRIVDVNLHGTFATSQEAARIMVGRGRGGRIVVVSSVNQDNVVPLQSHYCATKGGVRQLARAMALELAPEKITVNLIAPGATLTDMLREKFESDPAWAAQVVRKYPLGRIGVPDDFRGAAVFLASDESAFITGATIVVDGGLTLSR